MPSARPLRKSKNNISYSEIDMKPKQDITVVISDSSTESGEQNDSGSLVINQSDVTISSKDNPPSRPKRSIERRNYNQTKLAKEMFQQNQNKTPSVNTNKKKLDENKYNRSVERVAKQKLKKELKPPSKLINLDKVLAQISPFKKSFSLKSNVSSTRKLPEQSRADDKFSKIIHRAFRYPWEWNDINKTSNQYQILGFRTLSDGNCETLMWSR